MTRRLLIALTTLLLLPFVAEPSSAQESVDYTISWQPNVETDITTYLIYRSLNQFADFSPIDSVDASTYSYTDTGLEKGVRYYYRLVARNEAGLVSSFSQPVSAFTVPQGAPTEISRLCDITSIDKLSESSYNVQWSTSITSTGFVQYDIDTGLDLMSDWDATPGIEHSVALSDLMDDNMYYLRAVAYDDSKNMTVSETDTFTATSENYLPPSAPIAGIFPVPFHPNMGNLQLNNLPTGGSVTIYNEGGLEVWSTDIGTSTFLSWDGTNKSGSKVMSGVFYVFVKDETGDIIEKKPIIIVNK